MDLRGVGRNCRKGGAQFKGCEVLGFWRKAPKIGGCNRKPHLLFNDSLTGSSPYPVIQCTVRMCKGIVQPHLCLYLAYSYRIASGCIEVSSYQLALGHALGQADGLPLIYTSSPGSKLHRPEKVGLLCVASAEEGGALALKALPLPTPLDLQRGHSQGLLAMVQLCSFFLALVDKQLALWCKANSQEQKFVRTQMILQKILRDCKTFTISKSSHNSRTKLQFANSRTKIQENMARSLQKLLVFLSHCNR